MFVDGSKAFDKIKHSQLFNILIERNVCPLTIRMIVNMYAFNNSRVNQNSTKSNYFYLGNGIKQGGVLSPALFNIYLESLLVDLRNSNHGCRVGHICANSFAYADDIVLLSPTLYGIKELIKLCEMYSIDYSVTFNPSKCAIMYC